MKIWLQFSLQNSKFYSSQKILRIFFPVTDWIGGNMVGCLFQDERVPKSPVRQAFLELHRLPSWRLVRGAQKEPRLSSTSDGFWDLVATCVWTSVGRMAVSVIQCRTSSQAQVECTKITHVSGELLKLYLYILLWGRRKPFLWRPVCC